MGYEAKELEVVSEKTDKPKKQGKAKKTIGDHSKGIRFWSVFTSICFRLSIPGMFLGLAAGLCFWILYSQNSIVSVSFPMMIMGFAFAGVFVIMIGLGFIGRAFLNHYCRLDPNYDEE